MTAAPKLSPAGRLVREETGEQVPLLAGGSVVVGRAENVGWAIAHAAVSREHVRLEASAEGELWVTDLGSRNGTWLDGVRLPPRTRVRVGAGGLICVGSPENRLRWISEEPAAPPAPTTSAVTSGSASVVLHIRERTAAPEPEADSALLLMDAGPADSAAAPTGSSAPDPSPAPAPVPTSQSEAETGSEPEPEPERLAVAASPSRPVPRIAAGARPLKEAQERDLLARLERLAAQVLVAERRSAEIDVQIAGLTQEALRADDAAAAARARSREAEDEATRLAGQLEARRAELEEIGRKEGARRQACAQLKEEIAAGVVDRARIAAEVAELERARPALVTLKEELAEIERQRLQDARSQLEERAAWESERAETERRGREELARLAAELGAAKGHSERELAEVRLQRARLETEVQESLAQRARAQREALEVETSLRREQLQLEAAREERVKLAAERERLTRESQALRAEVEGLADQVRSARQALESVDSERAERGATLERLRGESGELEREAEAARRAVREEIEAARRTLGEEIAATRARAAQEREKADRDRTEAARKLDEAAGAERERLLREADARARETLAKAEQEARKRIERAESEAREGAERLTAQARHETGIVRSSTLSDLEERREALVREERVRRQNAVQSLAVELGAVVASIVPAGVAQRDRLVEELKRAARDSLFPEEAGPEAVRTRKLFGSDRQDTERARRFWVLSGGVVGTSLVLFALNWIFPGPGRALVDGVRDWGGDSGRAQRADEFVKRIREIRAGRPRFVPATDRRYREDYTANLLYFEGYEERKLDEATQRRWTLALNHFFVDQLKLPDSAVVRFVAAETGLIRELATLKSFIQPSAIDAGIRRMREAEATTAGDLRDIVGGEANWARVRKFEAEFQGSAG